MVASGYLIRHRSEAVEDYTDTIEWAKDQGRWTYAKVLRFARRHGESMREFKIDFLHEFGECDTYNVKDVCGFLGY